MTGEQWGAFNASATARWQYAKALEGLRTAHEFARTQYERALVAARREREVFGTDHTLPPPDLVTDEGEGGKVTRWRA